jgi:hypothetical protein
MFVLGARPWGTMTIVRRTLVLMHNQGIRAFVLLWDGNQGLVQVLGKGLVRTALWAVRSTGRWSGPRLAARWRPALDLFARRHNAPNSEIGTNAKCRLHRAMSEFGRKAEDMCSE